MQSRLAGGDNRGADRRQGETMTTDKHRYPKEREATEYVTVRRDDLVDVMDALAAVANDAGVFHEGLDRLFQQVFGIMVSNV
jgi:hypothetical protein